MNRNHIGVVFLLILVLCVFALWNMYHDVNRNSPEIMQDNDELVIETWYAPLTAIQFGEVSLLASIADTDEERAKGLSDTPYLPDGIVKLFIFPEDRQWSFWMKDMNYPIDIFWLDANGKVVYVVESASPDSYPETNFVPSVPARYVIETNAGFATEYNIKIGDNTDLTQLP